jgi:hypothetical protein
MVMLLLSNTYKENGKMIYSLFTAMSNPSTYIWWFNHYRKCRLFFLQHHAGLSTSLLYNSGESFHSSDSVKACDLMDRMHNKMDGQMACNVCSGFQQDNQSDNLNNAGDVAQPQRREFTINDRKWVTLI